MCHITQTIIFDYNKLIYHSPDMGLSGGQSLLGLNLDGRQSRASRRSSNAGGFQRSTRSLSRLAPASSHLVRVLELWDLGLL